MTRELVVVLELEAAEPVVVDAGVADNLCGDAVLRVRPELLRIGEHADEPLLQEEAGLRRVGEALDVDELALLVQELRVQRVAVDPEDLVRGERDPARIPHLGRVGVDRRRLLADRELDPGPVEDRPAAGWNRLGLLVLALRKLREVRRLHALKPERPREHRQECEGEDGEQQPDPPVRLLLAHRGGHRYFPRSM